MQDPEALAQRLRALHGGAPRVLGEDFCGTLALARAWVATDPRARAIGVDLDRKAMDYFGAVDRIETVHGDVVEATDPRAHAVDVLQCGNFSIGELRTRSELLRYLRHALARLLPGGLFVCDLYGGESAFLTGSVTRDHQGLDDTTIRYTWEQREADSLTSRVVCAMHFEVLSKGRVVQTVPDAFVYRWRLWGLAELRDAMMEAGFNSADVYGRPADDAGPLVSLDASYDVLVVAQSEDL